MPSKVDLPQPEGPLMATNSPRPISRSMPARAWVSISSVWKTLAMLSRRITASGMVFLASMGSIDAHAVVRIPLRHVRNDDLVARSQTLDHLDGVDGTAAQAHRHAQGEAALDQLVKARRPLGLD